MHFSRRIGSGLAGRFTQHACDSGRSILDRKWFHTLVEYQKCMLLYRFPAESPQARSDFYDGDIRSHKRQISQMTRS
jgi:hypothetical protein